MTTLAIYKVEVHEDNVTLLRGQARWGPWKIHDPRLAEKVSEKVRENFTRQLEPKYPQER